MLSRREFIHKVGAVAAVACSSPLFGSVPGGAPSTAAADGPVSELLGYSVGGRPINAFRVTGAAAARRVVVVGGLHGNEAIGPAFVEALLARTDFPADLEVVGVPVANPDGVAGWTRVNANGVDLNRNFPYIWGRSRDRRLRDRNPGRAATDQPETAAVLQLCDSSVLSMPTSFVWLHNPLGYVTSIGPSKEGGWYAQQWRKAARYRAQWVVQSGGSESYCAFELGAPSILVEHRGRGTEVAAHLDGFRAAFG
jgi:hypothetical protein